MLKVAGIRYRSWAQRRFLKNSRGGEWPPLKLATIEGKRRIGSRTPTAILRRFDTLLEALNPVFTGAPGQYEKFTNNAVDIGIGGPGAYPSGITVAKVAKIHQDGLGRVPKREIIILPPDSVRAGILSDVTKALERIRGG